MYSEWESYKEVIQKESNPRNVLNTFPAAVGREVVQAILKPLSDLSVVSASSRASSPSPQHSPFSTPEQVKWIMQVIGYGLTLPLTEQHLIAQCIDIYDTWLNAFHSSKAYIPSPILKNPNLYARIIFDQMAQLFMPRSSEQASLSSSGSVHHSASQHNHAVVCNRALQITHQVIRNANNKFSRETWQSLFKYLLKVVDTLLSPPPEPNSLGVTLCSLLIHVLFEAWLCACIVCFPTPSLWKTFRELFANWRHHHYVVEQWNKATYSLTLRVVAHLYGPGHLKSIKIYLPKEDKDFKVILDGMSKDVLVQSWFRILHTIGNPVEVSYPGKIVQSLAFKPACEEYETSKPKHKHSSAIQICMSELPKNFQEVMSGIARIVYLLLAQKIPSRVAKKVDPSAQRTAQGSPAPRKLRDELKPGNRGSTWYVNSPATSTVSLSSNSTSTLAANTQAIEVGRPGGNTLLHLLGEWLFEASIWPVERSLPGYSGLQDLVNVSDYEEGRAEALGALCSIFTSQHFGEPFQSVYLARFYHALAVGLQYNESACHGQMLTKIILNSRGLLRKDMKGINMMLPHLMKALQLILKPKELSFRCYVDHVELRYCSIDLLLSMLSLPLHYLDQPLPDLSKVIPELRPGGGQSYRGSNPSLGPTDSVDAADGSQITFVALKDQLLSVLFSAVESERDPVNVQLLLHALMVFMQDIVCYENAVSQMISEETVEDAEVSAINSHKPLGLRKSDASVQSQITLTPTIYSTSSLFKRSLNSGNYCLTEWGKSNVHVALAALELFGGLAELPLEDIDHSDSRSAILMLCDFILSQAMKNRTQHNRDLHTSIVAALNTLLKWINSHPYLLGNKESLTALMEVIELGVSGTVSFSNDGTSIYKGDKEMKPISGRVKEMAEYILYCVMEKSGAFPLPGGVEASSSLIREEDVIAMLPLESKNNAAFQYFVMDNSLVLGLLEGSFSTGSSRLPTVTAVVRSLTGRHVWSMQLRNNPRSDKVSMDHLHSKPRPVPKVSIPIPQEELERAPWPEEANQEAFLNQGQSGGSFSEPQGEEHTHSNFAQLTSQQIDQEREIERLSADHRDSVHFPDPAIAQEPPQTQESVSTARLFLNHLGLLGMETLLARPEHRQSSLVMLETGPPLQNTLSTLDRLPSRYCNTVFLFYLKEGFSKPEDILLAQKTLSDKPPEFMEFLEGLGWTVDPISHAGFSGRIREAKSTHPHTASAQIPLRPFPYYADAVFEVAFIMPTLRAPSEDPVMASIRNTESSDSGQETSSLSGQGLSAQTELISSMQPPISMKDAQGSGVSESAVVAKGASVSSHSDKRKLSKTTEHLAGLESPRSRRGAVPQDCAAIVVWLEKFEDQLNFPLESLSSVLHGGALGGSQKNNKRVLPVTFIHMLSSGLFQISTKNPNSRADSLAGPLTDGMVVSRRSLSTLVRQTTLNVCQRHRMENEGYCPPHVKRKRKIEEMCGNFGMKTSVAQFYTKLFSPL